MPITSSLFRSRAAGVLLAAACVVAHAQTVRPAASSAAATVSAFHAALAAADSTTALKLLAPDAVILESGQRETRDEYRDHHLQADIRFAQAVPARRSAVQAVTQGDVAWVSSKSLTRGTFQDRPVHLGGAELMVLSKTSTGWLIRAIHWSSHPIKSAD